MNLAQIFIFWIIIQIFSLIGLPVAFTLLRNLPDRGYVLAKPIGILLVAYVLWLAGSFGLLRNNLGGTFLAMGLVMLFGIIWYRGQNGPTLLGWLKGNWTYVLTVEVLFTGAFGIWTWYKAHTPAIETAGGEKFMEIAFINANLLSPGFPPQDPWLSGFGISYYYFGYVFTAMLIRLSGIASTTAFNLLVPTLFGLTLIAAYGLVTNMVAIHQRATIPTTTAKLTGLFGALFVGVMGHWEGLLEVLHSRGLLPANFWIWLDIRDLKVPPDGPGPWIPDRFIWWWRGSRVLTDYNLAGFEQEVIDEIPIFSFLLGDVHPHVLSMPFVLLAATLAFNLLLQNRQSVTETAANWLARLITAMGGKIEFVLYALCFGVFSFLNFWDLPIYLAVLGLAYLIWLGRDALLEAVLSMIAFAIFGAILFLPFHISFQSQASGILPNLWNPTRLPQFFVLFGPLLVISIGFLIVLSKQAVWPFRQNLRWTLPLTIIGPVIVLLVLGAGFFLSASGQQLIGGHLNDPNIQAAIGGGTQSALLQEILRRRLGNPWTFLLLAGLLGWALAHFWTANDGDSETPSMGSAERFAIILLMVGVLFPLSVEFVFLRDNFGYRMNTIFKFYIQAWILLALISAFGVYYVGQALEISGRLAWQAAVTIMVLAGMVYPVLAVLNRANNFRNDATLDGIAWVANRYPDDHDAILWLRENAAPDAVILEAVAERADGSYMYEGRISALTGRPAILGWGGHQNQWRGDFTQPSQRHPDVELLYNTLDLQTTLTLLDKYDITYVYVGPIERQKYRPAGLEKFGNLLDVAFQQGDVVIYQRQETTGEAVSEQ